MPVKIIVKKFKPINRPLFDKIVLTINKKQLPKILLIQSFDTIFIVFFIERINNNKRNAIIIQIILLIFMKPPYEAGNFCSIFGILITIPFFLLSFK